MPSYLVTGASRSIGFAFLAQLSADPSNTVVGMVRDKAKTDAKVAAELPDRSNIHIVQADLDDLASLKASVPVVSNIVSGALDYIIANGGLVSSYSAYVGFGSLSKDPEGLEQDLLACFRTNLIGNVHLINLYLPLVLKGTAKKVIALSSGFADIDLVKHYDVEVAIPYTISKYALNMAIAKFSTEFKKDGVLFVAMAPGAVEVGQDANATEEEVQSLMKLGAKFMEYAPDFKGRVTPEEGVKTMLGTIDKLSIERGDAGAFISQNGDQKWL